VESQEATLKLVLKNTGTENVKDIRVKLSFPSGISSYNDVDFKKIAIIAGTGVRNYYKKFGYILENTFMIKQF
jgi:hypothetical protein